MNIDLTSKDLTFAEKLGFGGQMLLIGMLTVFAVLTLIWITLTLFKFFFHDLAKRSNKTKSVKDTVQAANYAPSAGTNEEIVAVIAAAIAMAESESNNGTKFRVVSFRRK